MNNADNVVYITQSNWNRVLKKVQRPELNLDQIYDKDLSVILSEPELTLLALAKESFENADFWSEVHLRAESSVDTKTYAFEGGSPAYHFTPACQKLTANYTNLVIPVDIKEKGDLEIAKFRDFCKQNRPLLDTNEQLFRTRLEAQFFLKNPIRKISRDNSGSLGQLNLDLAAIKKRIDRLLDEADGFMHRDDKTMQLIQRLGYGTHRCKEAKEKGSALYIWHYDYKSNLKTYLQTYFRVKFNPDLCFRGDLLDELGFSACASCH